MASQLSLTTPKTWLLILVAATLCMLFFVAGLLTGVLVSQRPELSEKSTSEKNGKIVRRAVPDQQPVQKAEKPSPAVVPMKIPKMKAPVLKVPTVKPPVLKAPKVPGVKIAQTPVRADKALQKTAGKSTAPSEQPEEETKPKEGEKTRPDDIHSPEIIEPEFPYSLRLASYQDLKRAKKVLPTYRDRGISAYIVRVNLGQKGVWYRIYSGHYRNQETAMADRDKYGLKEVEIIRTRWANLIGAFEDETSTASLFDQLAADGYYPYVVKGGNGLFRLYIGAFITRKGAEAQQRVLKSGGIDSRIIPR